MSTATRAGRDAETRAAAFLTGQGLKLLDTKMKFEDKGACRSFFQQLTQTCRDWNNSEFQGDDFNKIEEEMSKALAEVSDYAE